MRVNAYHFFALISIITAQQADITIPPQPVNITINKVAVFHCTGVANSFTWRANGQQLDHGEGIAITPVSLVNETLQIRMSTLRVTVTSVNNATNITCTAFRLGNPKSSIDKSNSTLLLVQGLLESVSNLTVVSINCTTVLISWSPPFTLEGVPILGYNVTITNTTSGENVTVETDTTVLYYSIDNYDPDLTVAVVPINEVGTGEPTMVQIQPTLKESVPTSHIQVVSTAFTSKYSGDAVQLSIATPSVTVNLVPTTPVQNNQTVPNALILTIIGCVVVITIIITITITVVTCCLVLFKKRKSSLSQNKIPVDENPAYEEVTLKQSRIDVQENSAYSTYNPYSIII